MDQTTLDGLTHEQLKEEFAKREQAFFVNRGKVEEAINLYLNRIFTLYESNPTLFEGVEMPCGRTAKEVVPAMYEDDFDSVKYKEQRRKLLDFQKIMTERADTINRRALAECL